MVHLSILVYVMIFNKVCLRKISTEDDFEKNKLSRSAARLGRGFQTRPSKQARVYIPTFVWLFRDDATTAKGPGCDEGTNFR